MTTEKEMVELFQCPGCTVGSNTNCGSYVPNIGIMGHGCSEHSAGTFIAGIGCVNIGLPTGFNRNGPVDKTQQRTIVRLFSEMPKYDKFNVPVWAMEKDGYLFVRRYLPRRNQGNVDVIKGGKIANITSDLSLPINVTDFFDEID